MRDEEIDPSFKSFAKNRPQSRDVWFRAWGLYWYPVSAMGFLMLMLPIAFMLGWAWLLKALGLSTDGNLGSIPMFAVWILAMLMAIRHTESI
jgi:hypothetical protein